MNFQSNTFDSCDRLRVENFKMKKKSLLHLQVQSKPFFFFGKSPLVYTWGQQSYQPQPQIQQYQQYQQSQYQQPQYQQPQYQQTSYVSSPLLDGARFQESIVSPFKGFLQKQAIFQSSFGASPQYYGRSETPSPPSFPPTYGPPAPTYGPPTAGAPQFAPTGPPASVYGVPNYQQPAFQPGFQPPNYQPPSPFNQQPPSQSTQFGYTQSPGPIYGLPPNPAFGGQSQISFQPNPSGKVK